MTNVYMNWTQIKAKKTGEELIFYYHKESVRWQIYLLDGNDAFICYLPTQETLDNPAFITDNKTGLQSDLNDFNDNFKSGATETEGAKD